MGDTSEHAGVDLGVINQINNEQRKDLLDTIDGLRDIGIDGIVSLPQIIVVGDQSSGKSSVLEAISRVRFPMAGGVCTRFATELVLRKAAKASTDVEIIFSTESSRPEPAAPFQKSDFDIAALPDIIQEAQERMGVRDGKGYSKDVLRIGIAGPDKYPLTLIDLPGIFRNATDNQPEEGIEVVDQLVESYMRQRNSIILAVVKADNTLVQQDILNRALRHDQARERTIGVITKPDRVDPGSSDEQAFIRLARGEERTHRLTLGWHVLRNRSERQEGKTADERDAEEAEFFESGSWSALPPSSRGVESLRKKLGEVLLNHIQKNLPTLIQDIEDKLRIRENSLKKLGSPRPEDADKRSFLLDIARDFERLARDGVRGTYDDDEFFGGPKLGQESDVAMRRRLRAMLRNLNRAFDSTLEAKGASYNIEGEHRFVNDVPDYLKPFIKLYNQPAPTSISNADLSSKLEHFAAANQALELPGQANARIVNQLFKDWSEPWRSISEIHLKLVMDQTRFFVESLFEYIVQDAKTSHAILTVHVDPILEKKKVLLQEKLSEILRPFTDGYGLPLEPEFRSKLSSKTSTRTATAVADDLEKRHPQAFGEDSKKGLDRIDILDSFSRTKRSENSNFGTVGAVDMMLALYEMYLTTFTNNVIQLVVEGCLVSAIPEIFTSRIVDRMAKEKLNELAEEHQDIRFQREQLLDETKKLREGFNKCRKFRLRVSPGMYKFSTLRGSGLTLW